MLDRTASWKQKDTSLIEVLSYPDLSDHIAANEIMTYQAFQINLTVTS